MVGLAWIFVLNSMGEKVDSSRITTSWLFGIAGGMRFGTSSFNSYEGTPISFELYLSGIKNLSPKVAIGGGLGVSGFDSQTWSLYFGGPIFGYTGIGINERANFIWTITAGSSIAPGSGCCGCLWFPRFTCSVILFHVNYFYERSNDPYIKSPSTWGHSLVLQGEVGLLVSQVFELDFSVATGTPLSGFYGENIGYPSFPYSIGFFGKIWFANTGREP